MDIKKRHKLYSQARRSQRLKMYRKLNIRGLCSLFSQLRVRDVYYNCDFKYETAPLPELWCFITKAYPDFGDANPWDVRETILEFCIEMTR